MTKNYKIEMKTDDGSTYIMFFECFENAMDLWVNILEETTDRFIEIPTESGFYSADNRMAVSARHIASARFIRLR